jgi:hypothetical protein
MTWAASAWAAHEVKRCMASSSANAPIAVNDRVGNHAVSA